LHEPVRSGPRSAYHHLMAPQPLVLIVDDVRDNREGYAEYLRFRGFRVLEAATGNTALDVADRCHPDVIVLDIRLPDIDGTEVTRRLRAAGFERTTIIAVSACVSRADVGAAIESGCDSFLPKPCLPDALVNEINRLLSAHPQNYSRAC
jgi:two-component system, cell cycle response regulator DivK